MAKSTTKPSTKSSQHPPSSSGKVSEIDDIFSAVNGKGKASPSANAEPPSTAAASKKKPKSKKGKSGSSVAPSAETSAEATSSSKKRPPPPEPEVIHDPSAKIEATVRAKRQKTTFSFSTAPDTRNDKATEDHLRFIDSRGTDPRRQTEEGYLIYKEDELGITDGGGDTPLCPFDCECCF